MGGNDVAWHRLKTLRRRQQRHTTVCCWVYSPRGTDQGAAATRRYEGGTGTLLRQHAAGALSAMPTDVRVARHAPECRWLHPYVMRFTTIIRVRTPRCHCQNYGVGTIAVFRAQSHDRFSCSSRPSPWRRSGQPFAAPSLQPAPAGMASALLAIMARAVARGRLRRSSGGAGRHRRMQG